MLKKTQVKKQQQHSKQRCKCVTVFYQALTVSLPKCVRIVHIPVLVTFHFICQVWAEKHFGNVFLLETNPKQTHNRNINILHIFGPKICTDICSRWTLSVPISEVLYHWQQVENRNNENKLFSITALTQLSNRRFLKLSN